MKTYNCRHCGGKFSPRPNKPGFVDECEPCWQERAPKPTVVARVVVKSRTMPISVRVLARELEKPLKVVTALVQRKRKLGWASDLDWLKSKKRSISVKTADEIRKYYADIKAKKVKNLSAIPIQSEIDGLRKLLANPKTPKQLKPSKQKRLDLLLAQIEASKPKPEPVATLPVTVVKPRPMTDLELEIWLSTLRRTLVRFVDELDPQSLTEKLELGVRIANLREAQVMPKYVASAMLFINTMRNRMEYRSERPDAGNLLRTASAWKTVEQWARKERSKLGREMEVLHPENWRDHLLKVLSQEPDDAQA